MPMRPGWITALVLGASLASACGSAAIGDGSSPGDTEPGNGYPMRSASDMTAVARNELPAASAVPFEASFPRSAGKPLVVFVYDPVQPLAGVDAEYDASSPYGAFRLREERTPAGVLERDFVRSVSGFCSDGGDGAGSGCTSALVDVGAGLRGAILYGPNGDTSVTAVETLDGQDYKLIVMGPRATFTPDRAEAAMRDVVARFHPVG